MEKKKNYIKSNFSCGISYGMQYLVQLHKKALLMHNSDYKSLRVVEGNVAGDESPMWSPPLHRVPPFQQVTATRSRDLTNFHVVIVSHGDPSVNPPEWSL